MLHYIDIHKLSNHMEEKVSVHHPHDGITKSALMNKEVAVDFLRANLPEGLFNKINVKTLNVTDKSFIIQELKQIHSDVIYESKIKGRRAYIQFIIEQQSTPHELMAFRLFQYALNGMQKHLSQGHKKLPVIIPICLYHGSTSPYPYSTNIFDCFEDPDTAKQYMLKDFYLIDLTIMDEHALNTQKSARLMTELLKYANNRDFMKHLLNTLKNGAYHDFTLVADIKHIEDMLQYALAIVEKFDKNANKGRLIEQMIEYLPDEKRDDVMNLREHFKNEKAIEIARSMLSDGLDVKSIKTYTGLTAKDINKIRKTLESQKK